MRFFRHIFRGWDGMGSGIRLFRHFGLISGTNIGAYHMTGNKSRGFTLLEVIVVVAIVIIIMTTSFTMGASFIVDRTLEAKTHEVAETLKLAQIRSLTRYQNSQWGVLFQQNSPPTNDRYILFKGTSYATRDVAYDVIVDLPDFLSFTNIGFGGSGTQVVFAKLTGKTTQAGSVRLTTTGGDYTTVSVNGMGVVQKSL